MNGPLHSLTVASLLPSFAFFIKKLLKFTKSCTNEIYLQEIKKCLLFHCRHYNANVKLDQSVFAIHDSPLYFEISEIDHSLLSSPHHKI